MIYVIICVYYLFTCTDVVHISNMMNLPKELTNQVIFLILVDSKEYM